LSTGDRNGLRAPSLRNDGEGGTAPEGQVLVEIGGCQGDPVDRRDPGGVDQRRDPSLERRAQEVAPAGSQPCVFERPRAGRREDASLEISSLSSGSGRGTSLKTPGQGTSWSPYRIHILGRGRFGKQTARNTFRPSPLPLPPRGGPPSPRSNRRPVTFSMRGFGSTGASWTLPHGPNMEMRSLRATPGGRPHSASTRRGARRPRLGAAAVPRKTGKRRVTTGSSRDRTAGQRRDSGRSRSYRSGLHRIPKPRVAGSIPAGGTT
jgi:hypothetical protein